MEYIMKETGIDKSLGQRKQKIPELLKQVT